MSETQLTPTLSSSDHFSRATASLKAAQRDAQAAIDSAVDGLSTAYGESKPMLSRMNQRAREMAHDGYDAARERAAALRDRGAQAVDSTRGYVQDEPIKSLLIAAAVGAAVIALVEVVRIRRNR